MIVAIVFTICLLFTVDCILAWCNVFLPRIKEDDMESYYTRIATVILWGVFYYITHK